jgi:hypothetical protein
MLTKFLITFFKESKKKIYLKNINQTNINKNIKFATYIISEDITFTGSHFYLMILNVT